jgi:hypothetical protein
MLTFQTFVLKQNALMNVKSAVCSSSSVLRTSPHNKSKICFEIKNNL